MHWSWKKIKPYTRSVAFRWMVSYAVILLIPVILSIIIYSQTREIVEYEIKRASSAMLQQVRYIVDGELQQTESLATQLSIQPEFKKWLNGPSADHPYLTYQTKQELGNLLATHDFIKGIYLYSNKLGTVLSGDTYADARLFFELQHATSSYSYEEWLDMMQTEHAGSYITLPVEIQGRKTVTPAYIRSLPMQVDGTPAGTLLFPLHNEKIRTLLENIDWVKQGQVFIMDERNQVLFQNGDDSEFASLSEPWELEGTGTFTRSFDGIPSMVTIEASDTTGWRYVSVFPTEVFWERARTIQTLNGLGLLLCFLIGGAVIYYFARKNYDPVKQLVSVFAKGQSGHAGADADEYSFIQRSVLETIRERDDMSNKQTQQLRVLQHYYLARALKGQADRSIPLSELSRTYHLQWTSERFGVLLFYIESDASDVRVLDMAQFIVSNILADFVPNHLAVRFTDVDGTLAAVVNVADDSEACWKMELEDALAQAHEFIATRYKLRFTTAGSDLQTGLDGIHQAFLQALEAQEYRIVLGEGQSLWYGEVKPAKSSYFFTVNEQMILLNLLKAGDYDKAQGVIDDVVEQAFQTQASLEIIRFVLLDLATTLIKAIPDDEQTAIAWDEWRPLKRLLACTSKAEFHQELSDIRDQVCGVLRSRQNVQTQAGIGEKVTAFVQEHYGDKNLSVSLIGDHFRLSPQYVSRLFREQTGQGLHDFISQTRVQAAKSLLQEGSSIDDTAEGVGFASGHAFIRVFKKYEGITPGKYKTIN